MGEQEEIEMLVNYAHKKASEQCQLPHNALVLITPFGDAKKGVVLAGLDFNPEQNDIGITAEKTIPADESLAKELRGGLGQLQSNPVIIIDTMSLDRLTADPSITTIREDPGPYGSALILGLTPTPLKAVVVDTMIPNG